MSRKITEWVRNPHTDDHQVKLALTPDEADAKFIASQTIPAPSTRDVMTDLEVEVQDDFARYTGQRAHDKIEDDDMQDLDLELLRKMAGLPPQQDSGPCEINEDMESRTVLIAHMLIAGDGRMIDTERDDLLTLADWVNQQLDLTADTPVSTDEIQAALDLIQSDLSDFKFDESVLRHAGGKVRDLAVAAGRELLDVGKQAARAGADRFVQAGADALRSKIQSREPATEGIVDSANDLMKPFVTDDRERFEQMFDLVCQNYPDGECDSHGHWCKDTDGRLIAYWDIEAQEGWVRPPHIEEDANSQMTQQLAALAGGVKADAAMTMEVAPVVAGLAKVAGGAAARAAGVEVGTRAGKAAGNKMFGESEADDLGIEFITDGAEDWYHEKYDADTCPTELETEIDSYMLRGGFERGVDWDFQIQETTTAGAVATAPMAVGAQRVREDSQGHITAITDILRDAFDDGELSPRATPQEIMDFLNAALHYDSLDATGEVLSVSPQDVQAALQSLSESLLGTVGGAIVGGAALGPAGAVGGAMLGRALTKEDADMISFELNSEEAYDLIMDYCGDCITWGQDDVMMASVADWNQRIEPMLYDYGFDRGRDWALVLDEDFNNGYHRGRKLDPRDVTHTTPSGPSYRRRGRGGRGDNLLNTTEREDLEESVLMRKYEDRYRRLMNESEKTHRPRKR